MLGSFAILTFNPSATFSGIFCCILNKSMVSLTVFVWFKVGLEESFWWQCSLFSCMFASFTYRSVSRMVIAPPLSAFMMIISSLFCSSFNALSSLLVRFLCLM